MQRLSAHTPTGLGSLLAITVSVVATGTDAEHAALHAAWPPVPMIFAEGALHFASFSKHAVAFPKLSRSIFIPAGSVKRRNLHLLRTHRLCCQRSVAATKPASAAITDPVMKAAGRPEMKSPGVADMACTDATMAMPRAPPICWSICNRPDAAPVSASGTASMMVTVPGANTSAIPVAWMTRGISTPPQIATVSAQPCKERQAQSNQRAPRDQ